MASVGSLDDLLNSKVDESAFTAIVGSLENHLYPGQLSTSANNHNNSVISSFSSGETKDNIIRNSSYTTLPHVTDSKDHIKLETISNTKIENTTVKDSCSVYNPTQVIYSNQSVNLPLNVHRSQVLPNGSAGEISRSVSNSSLKMIEQQPVFVTQSQLTTSTVPNNVTATPINNNVHIVNVSQNRAHTVGMVNQKTLAPRVVLSSHLLNRVGQPNQPITLQALQSLPGAASGGHLLVKTENGQLKLIQLPVSLHGASVSSVNANVSHAIFKTHPTIIPVSACRTIAPTMASVTAVQSASAPAATTTSPSTSANSYKPQPQAMTPDTAKIKCKNFLSTLLRLAKDQPDHVGRNVRQLIQSLIDACIEPELFTTQLQEALNSSPQPCLVPFLKKSLPYLRQSLFTKEMVIEGVKPPPAAALSSHLISAVTSSNSFVQSRVMCSSTSTFAVRTFSSTMTAASIALSYAQTPSTQSRGDPPNGVSASLHTVAAQSVGQHHAALFNVHPMCVKSEYGTQQTLVMTTVAHHSSGSGDIYHHSSGGARVTGVYSPSSAVRGAYPTAVSSATPFHPPAANQALYPKRDRYRYPVSAYRPSSTSYEAGNDDDINDVAAMGGVNLQEETQNILGNTEFIGTQIRSVRDETLLPVNLLSAKLKQIVCRYGLGDPSASVVTLVSHALEHRLRSLLERVCVACEHRTDLLKFEPDYRLARDVRGQLRFLDALERLEQKRNEEVEREMLLKAAKSRSKNEDPEQAKLKAKAREMQRVELEEVRLREANITALQAIGPRKKPRLDVPNATDACNMSGTNCMSGSEPHSSSSVIQRPLRSRMKRVNMRDVQFVLEQEGPSCSRQLHKLMLK